MADRRKGSRRRRTIIGAAVAAVVVVAVMVAARMLIPADAVRGLVAARLGEALGRTVTIDEARGGLLPRPWIELRGLTAAEGPEGVAVSADALRLRLRWSPLLRREVQVDQAELEAPRVMVRLRDAAGGDGAAGAPAAGAAAPAPASLPVSLLIEHVRLSHGTVRVIGIDGAPLLDLAGVSEDLALRASIGGDVGVAGVTTIDTLRLHLPTGELGEGLAVSWRKDLRWEAAAGRLAVVTSEVKLGDLPVALTGEVAGLAAGTPRVDLRLAGGPVRLESLQGFLPPGLVPAADGVRSEGTASVEATVQGPLAAGADSLAWDLRFALTGGSVRHPDLPAPLEEISIIVRAGPALVTIGSLAARCGDSRLSLNGKVADPLRDPTYDLDLAADLDLALAAAFMPAAPAGSRPSGRAEANLKAQGRAADPASLVLRGSWRLAGVALPGQPGALPVRDLEGRGRLDGRVLAIDNLSLHQGRSDYRVQGTITDPAALAPAPPAGAPATAAVALTVTSTLLDVDEILAAGRAAKAAVRQASAANAPPAGGTAAPAAEPPAAVLALQKLAGRAGVDVASLVVRGQRLTKVRGEVSLDRGRLSFPDATAVVHGGAGSLSGTVDLTDAAAGSFAFHLDVRNARTEQFFADGTVAGRFTRLAAALSGGLDVSADFASGLDDTFGVDLASLTAGGSVALHEAKLAGLPLQAKLATLLESPGLEAISFKDVRQPFRVEQGRLTLPEVALQAGPISIAGSGWQTLDGAIDARLDLTLPPDKAQGLRRQLPPAMADLLLDSEGADLVVPVTVGGRAVDPQVTVDTQRLAAAASARAEARLARETDKLKRQAVAEAERSLRQLLNAPADTAAAAGDTAAPPTLKDLGRSLLDRLKGKGGGDAP